MMEDILLQVGITGVETGLGVYDFLSKNKLQRAA